MTSKEEKINAVLDLYRSSGPDAKAAINKTAKILWPDTDWTTQFQKVKAADASDMSEGELDIEEDMWQQYKQTVGTERGFTRR